MGYARFWKRVRLVPGVTLNLARRGPSLSFGFKGAHLTLARSGIRRTVGIPGSGIFYTARAGWHSGIHSGQQFHEAEATAQAGRPTTSHVMLGLLVLLAAAGVIAALAAMAFR
jgi:hypothetical protein